MILPHSQTILLTLMILGLFCWGSWAALYKFGGKLRSEVFYLDFALGVGLAAAVCAYTAGSMGYDGFTVMDDVLNTGKHQILYGFVSGVLFNFGNMLLLMAVVVAGMALSFPASFAMATAAAAALGYLVNGEGSLPLVLAGASLLLVSVVANASVQRRLALLRHEALAKAGKAKSTRRPTARKGIILAAAGGLLMGTSYPLLARAQAVEIGLGPYSVALLFAAGMVACTVILTLFFMNMPVEGEALEVLDLFRTRVKDHLVGTSAGVLWFVGFIATLVVSNHKADLRANPALSFGLAQAAPLVAAAWGVFVWKELRGGDTRARLFTLLVMVLFLLGTVLIALTRLPQGAV